MYWFDYKKHPNFGIKMGITFPQLALPFTYKKREKYPLVAEVTASERKTVVKRYFDREERLLLIEIGKEVPLW